MKFSEIIKNKVFLGLLALTVVVVVVVVVLHNKESFVGLDSDILKSIGLFGSEAIEPEYEEQELVLPANDDSECMKPSDFSEQQKFLSEKVEQLTSNDLLPASEDYVLDNNYLVSGFQHGSDSRVAKNANQQLRADPPVPVIPNLTPFNQAVITSQDTLRKPLE